MSFSGLVSAASFADTEPRRHGSHALNGRIGSFWAYLCWFRQFEKIAKPKQTQRARTETRTRICATEEPKFQKPMVFSTFYPMPPRGILKSLPKSGQTANLLKPWVNEDDCRQKWGRVGCSRIHGPRILFIFAVFEIHEQMGTWCSGITPAQHAGGPGFNPQRVHGCLPNSISQQSARLASGGNARFWKECISRESNPGHIDGNDVFCH